MKDTLYKWWMEASLADIRRAADEGCIYTGDSCVGLPVDIQKYLNAYANIYGRAVRTVYVAGIPY